MEGSYGKLFKMVYIYIYEEHNGGLKVRWYISLMSPLNTAPPPSIQYVRLCWRDFTYVAWDCHQLVGYTVWEVWCLPEDLTSLYVQTQSGSHSRIVARTLHPSKHSWASVPPADTSYTSFVRWTPRRCQDFQPGRLSCGKCSTVNLTSIRGRLLITVKTF